MRKKEPKTPVGAALRYYRVKENNLTQYELAKEMNLSQTTISEIERGYTPGSYKTKNIITDYFNVSYDEFLQTGVEQLKLLAGTQPDKESYGMLGSVLQKKIISSGGKDPNILILRFVAKQVIDDVLKQESRKFPEENRREFIDIVQEKLHREAVAVAGHLKEYIQVLKGEE